MSRLAFDKVGAVYVWIAIIVVFSIWVPETFPNVTTAKQILNSNAITALAALSVTIPLAAKVFDLSFALNMTLCGVAVAHFVVDGVPLVLAVGLGVLIGLAVGLINATVVVGMKIDSFIATLATGSLIQALITLVTNDTPISDVKLAGGFAKIGQTTSQGLILPVLYVAVVAVGIWYLLEHTATGRRLYAVGFNADAARLAGVKVARLQFLALVTSGVLAGVHGNRARLDPRRRLPHGRHALPAPGLRGGLPRRHPAQERPVQRRRHPDRGAAARHRDDRARPGQRPAVVRRPVRRASS